MGKRLKEEIGELEMKQVVKRDCAGGRVKITGVEGSEEVRNVRGDEGRGSNTSEGGRRMRGSVEGKQN